MVAHSNKRPDSPNLTDGQIRAEKARKRMLDELNERGHLPEPTEADIAFRGRHDIVIMVGGIPMVYRCGPKDTELKPLY